jgi:hypothetical protein
MMMQYSNFKNGMSKMAIVAVVAMFIVSCTQIGSNQKSIKTLYPTKDWVISDFVVTDPVFGAKAESGFDNRAAFQAAIDAAYIAGGGVVYIPAGNYEFHSTQIGSRSVRVRRGAEDSIQNFEYQYVLQLPQSVQLRGDWIDPEKNDGKVRGTILEVRVGKDSPNYDGTVESWFRDGQAAVNLSNPEGALRTTYTSIADRFIDMREGTGVTNLSIWYPEQDINDVRPYPWTLYQATGNSATVENVTLVNSYNGFYSAPSELHYVLNSRITALNTGVEVHVCTDIGRVENVRINPKYWANSGLPGAPSLASVTAYTKANGTGFQMHRSDWEYVSYLYVSGYKTGIWIGREPGYVDAPNANLFEIHVDDCETALFVQDVNPYGLLFSNSSFGAVDAGVAVYFHDYFFTSTQFNGVHFNGPIVSNGVGGAISFESCTFDNFEEYALKINGGSVLITQSEFKKPAGHLYLGENVNTVRSLNSGYNRNLEVTNNSKDAKVYINVGDEYLFEAIPQNIKTDIAVHPRPKSNRVLRVDLPRTTGFNNDQPTVDVAEELQSVLNSIKKAGGGTVYLPAGRYLVESPITVPSGVELRGTWDVQHHTQSGGTAIFTNYAGGADGENGTSFIQLQANSGLRGFKIVQLNIATDGFSNTDPRPTPFLIQGQGANVYIINVTVSVGDKGIDLASYDTGGHYVDYFAGVLARAGIWVGGGAEGGFIRNMQFNPHYGTRLPHGEQGYPNVALMRFVQGSCSSLKFADVKNQTIFNNFVYGSIYGIHFLKDAITGNYPGEMTVIGHGSDGCTYALFMEYADENTKIVAINSELVNTQILSQPIRAYVLVGDEVNTSKVHPDAQLILYNSAFWGSPTHGAIINSGTVRYQQANFQSLSPNIGRITDNVTGLDIRGGKVHVLSSYFAQIIDQNATDDSGYVILRPTGNSVEISNNHYKSGIRIVNQGSGRIFGTDITSGR